MTNLKLIADCSACSRGVEFRDDGTGTINIRDVANAGWEVSIGSVLCPACASAPEPVVASQPDVITELVMDRATLRESGVCNAGGCYGVFSDVGKCLYVGRSMRVLERVMDHFIDQRDGNGRQWRLSGCSEYFWKREFAPPRCVLHVWYSDEQFSLEQDLIKSLKPSHNKAKCDHRASRSTTNRGTSSN